MPTELAFITNPKGWPKWPALPVIKRGAWKCGIVMDQREPIVYVGANVFGLDEVPGETWEEKLSNFEAKTYPTFEALLEEWRID